MQFNEAIQLTKGQKVVVLETSKTTSVVLVDEAIPDTYVVNGDKNSDTALVFCEDGRVYTQNQIAFPQ